MNYTNKEDSIRLKELGFELDSDKCWKHLTIEEKDYGKLFHISDIDEHIAYIPAYTSDQLFEWLREWWEPMVRDFELLPDEMRIYHHLENWGGEVDFETNLTDMLAKAVIWILENER